MSEDLKLSETADAYIPEFGGLKEICEAIDRIAASIIDRACSGVLL